MTHSYNSKEALLGSLLSFFKDFFLYAIISFVSFHFFGLFFLFFVFFMFKKFGELKEGNFHTFFFSTLSINCGLILGSLFWMIEIDNGIYALFGILFVHSLSFILFFFFRKYLFSFIVIHLSLELLMNTLNLSYPGLTYGNVFGNTPFLVQWYSFTTVLGGSLWLLLSGFILYSIKGQYILKMFLIIVPIGLSLISFFQPQETYDDQVKVSVLDFEYVNTTNKNKIVFNIGKELTDSDSQVLLLPEQSFRGLSRNKFHKTKTFKDLKRLQEDSGIETIIVGSTFYKKKKYIANGLFLIKDNEEKFRIKKKLVPLTEYLPPSIQSLTKKITFSNNFMEDEEEIISSNEFLPLVCYEAFYSLYTASLVRDSSKIIYVLSSEKFLNNSYFGMLQYNNIVRLRAIELQMPLLKASSFGESVLYSKKGNLVEKSREKYHQFTLKY